MSYDNKDDEVDLLKSFSDMNINIRPENLYIFQLYQVLKTMGKDTNIESRKADFIVQVELLESTTRAVKKVDDIYMDELDEHVKKLKQESDKEEDRQKKHKLEIDIPFKIAQKKFEMLYRVLIYESQTNTDSVIC